MKTRLIFMIIFLAIALACSKDDDLPVESLQGTSWISQVIHETPPYYYGDEYQHQIKFLGESTFQWNLIYPSGGEDEIDDGVYSLDENIVVLNYSPTFRIENDKMIMLDDEKVVLTKQ